MAFLESCRGLAAAESKEWLKTSGERKHTTLEESFRGHYKRRVAETTHQMSLPFVVGKDHLMFTTRLKANKSENKKREYQKCSPERLAKREREKEDMIWKTTKEVKNDISLRKRVIRSLEDKNNRVRFQGGDSSSHSSSTSDFFTESDSGESTDEEVKFGRHERRGEYGRSTKASDRPAAAAAVNLLSFPKIGLRKKVAKREHSNHYLANRRKKDDKKRNPSDGKDKLYGHASQKYILDDRHISSGRDHGSSSIEGTSDSDDDMKNSASPDRGKHVVSRHDTIMTITVPKDSGKPGKRSSDGAMRSIKGLEGDRGKNGKEKERAFSSKYMASPAMSMETKKVDPTKDLLKEYRMVIKWREKQQISLQGHLETLHKKHKELQENYQKDLMEYKNEVESLTKRLNAHKQKNNTLASAHSKKERNLEKLMGMMEAQRLSFQKESDAQVVKVRKLELVTKRQKVEILDLKKKHSEEVLNLVNNAAEAQFCAWNNDEDIFCPNCKDNELKSAIGMEECTRPRSLLPAEGAGDGNRHARKLSLEIEMLHCQIESISSQLLAYTKSNKVLREGCVNSSVLQEASRCHDFPSMACQTPKWLNELEDISMSSNGSPGGRLDDQPCNCVHPLNATEEQEMDKLKQVLRPDCLCTECGEIFAKPRALVPCGHTFCSECISGKTECSICKAEFSLSVPNVLLESVSIRKMLTLCTERIMCLNNSHGCEEP